MNFPYLRERLSLRMAEDLKRP